VVDLSDALLMSRNYLGAGKTNWDQGNFNYDNAINFADAQILQKNYNAVASGSVIAADAGAAASSGAFPGSDVGGGLDSSASAKLRRWRGEWRHAWGG